MEISFTELLKELRRRNVEVIVKNGNLSYSGPEENITQELLDQLRFYKNRMISHLLDPKTSNIMPIQPEGKQIPLFLIHAQEANYDISSLLGNDQPIYGFFHIGSDGKRVNLKSVENLAHLYIDQMTSYYTGDEFYLIGYSFGGVLAYEIAVQLQNAGKKVGFLALVDVTAPHYSKHSIFHTYDGVLKAIKRGVFDVGMNWIKDRVRFLYCSTILLLNRSIPVADRPFYIVNRYLKIHRKYKPKPFNGDILLIKTDQSELRIKNYGWKGLVTNVKEYIVKGTHYGIFRNSDIPTLLVNEFKKVLSK